MENVDEYYDESLFEQKAAKPFINSRKTKLHYSFCYWEMRLLAKRPYSSGLRTKRSSRAATFPPSGLITRQGNYWFVCSNACLFFLKCKITLQIAILAETFIWFLKNVDPVAPNKAL